MIQTQAHGGKTIDALPLPLAMRHNTIKVDFDQDITVS